MKAALIKNGIVENFIIWDDTCQEIAGYEHVIVEDTVNLGVGWEYDVTTNVFIDPTTKNPDAWMEGMPYNDLRKLQYPPMGEYLDAVVKGDQAQIDKYIADCLAIKAKFPKP